ncbi:MAG: hypothetical protein HYY50_03885 [Candidatus Kerfeldbacteria bacterium]|nr:hypothetical protein [Candidatus Kerfeldbacteria bacterium]
MSQKRRGVFIAIEGTDGAGKATQVRLLARRIASQGRNVRTIAFPQYGKHSAAPIAAYLRGEYGSLKELGPYRASIFYAIDRVTARSKIMNWLRAGNVVIADRYIASNLAFQGSKISNWQARKRYWMWDEEFEFDLLGIPRPDCTLVLYVPPAVSQQLIRQKRQRAYLRHWKRDIHERDVRYQNQVAKVYAELSLFDRSMKIINCAPDGHLLPKEYVHKLVMAVVERRLR